MRIFLSTLGVFVGILSTGCGGGECTAAYQTADCEGLQVCICDNAIRPNKGGDYACVDRKDRPSGECVSRREFYRRGVEDGEQLADRICACRDTACVL